MLTRYIYKVASGQLVAGPGVPENSTFDLAAEAITEFADGRLLDFDRDRIDPITHDSRPATTEELQASVDAKLQAEVDREGNQKAIKATMIWTLKKLLGHSPTPAEIAAARAEWIAIYKQIP